MPLNVPLDVPLSGAQAMDRAHRIGQRRVVNVYRLVTRDTLEEKIMSTQAFKRHVAATVVNQQNAALSTMNTHELLDLFELAPARPSDAPTPDEAMLAEYAASATGAGEKPSDKPSAAHSRAASAGGGVDGGGNTSGGLHNLLETVGELWSAEQYEEEFDLQSFLATLGPPT